LQTQVHLYAFGGGGVQHTESGLEHRSDCDARGREEPFEDPDH
jgi:hypothetical protein